MVSGKNKDKIWALGKYKIKQEVNTRKMAVGQELVTKGIGRSIEKVVQRTGYLEIDG